MSIVNVNFFSEALYRYVNFTAILPIDKRSVDGEKRRSKEKPFKTLYLLHGIYGGEYDWLTGSRIKRWAQERNLAVIMPAGENKFYCDVEESGDRFAGYIGEDLVDFTRTMFRLSEKREDTYIAGLSMGGAGALLTGLRYADRFGKIGAFSSAPILDDYPEDEGGVGLKDRRSYYETVLGIPGDFNGGANDYRALAKKAACEGQDKPGIYMSCGLQDTLIDKNRSFAAELKALGYTVDYSEESGAHEWDFWDRQLLKFLDWLPVEDKSVPEAEL